MHVTREGPDVLSRYCPVQAFGPGGSRPITVAPGEPVWQSWPGRHHPCRVVGGVDTHKDLHVAAVVDEHDRVLGSQCFATTRQGYRQMLAWMRSFGQLGASALRQPAPMAQGLLRHLQNAGVEVLEVTTPDKT